MNQNDVNVDSGSKRYQLRNFGSKNEKNVFIANTNK